jgi:hypothetical protein
MVISALGIAVQNAMYAAAKYNEPDEDDIDETEEEDETEES